MKPRRQGLKLQVVAPCSEDWDSMPGGDDIRFCGRCRQNVYNLSEMNETQVRELVQGPVCVRFFARGDGTVVTRQCSPMLEAARRRMVAMAAGLLPLAAAFWGSVAWLRGKVHVQSPLVMGGIRAVPPPEPVQGAAIDPVEPPRPLMAEPEPVPPREPRRLMGKPAPAPRHIMGEPIMGAPPPPRLMGRATPPKAK